MEQFNIYLIGGMSKFGVDKFNEGNEWRLFVKSTLEDMLCKYRVNVCNPNDYYNFLDNTTYDNQREIMEFDLNKVRNSNLCIANFNDVGSLGSMAELAIAYERRIPIIGLCENNEHLHPWQIEMINKKFTDKYDLIEYIRKFYFI